MQNVGFLMTWLICTQLKYDLIEGSNMIFHSLTSLWNNSLIRISILRDYWLETMRDGHKHLLIYLDKFMGVYLNPLLRA